MSHRSICEHLHYKAYRRKQKKNLCHLLIGKDVLEHKKYEL